MKIVFLRKMRYLNTWIYIMQFEYVFMYLIPHGNEIYQDRITLVPNWFTRLAWRLGMIEVPFSKEQLEEGEKIALSGAMKTLDELNDPKKVWEKRKETENIAKQVKKSNDCVWQATEGKDGMYYECLTHKEIVPMVDGEQPEHGFINYA